MYHKTVIGSSMVMALAVAATVAHAADPVSNSIGMKMIPVAPGEFIMGSVQPSPNNNIPPAGPRANWDERTLHRVRISKPFLISETEVTAEQYKQFKPNAVLNEKYVPYAAGMSWNDAVAFCAWLSQKEGKTYRLPTEAEWEYVCKAGRPEGTAWEIKLGEANPWGVKNTLIGPVEWCSDWYGEYSFADQVDPVGYAGGFMKVIRGGHLDIPGKSKPEHYQRAAARTSAPPTFGPNRLSEPNPEGWGVHRIGIRLVQGDAPTTAPQPVVEPYARQGVKQTTNGTGGPDMSKPYFHRRKMLPIPLEDERDQTKVDQTGLHPSFRFHCHSPGFEILPNGDRLMVIYSSYWEYEPEVTLIATRLPPGAEEWDMPSPFMDTAGANDHAPLLSTQGNTVRLFWGNPQVEGYFPFNMITSKDNGATFTPVTFPLVNGPIGPVQESPQPINTVLRDKNGTLYMACDAGGGAIEGVPQAFSASHSLLWASDDDGLTWRDTIGRSYGRHTTFALGKDGSTIIGYGGKNGGIEGGFMPKSISTDGGRTYQYSKTPFAQLAGGQRPSLLRLASGRLFMSGDFEPSRGTKPASIKETGAYVALSDDEGETWHIKSLPGTWSPRRNNYSVGYSAARQAPNGLINLITSKTHPAVHFEINEAWILSDQTVANDDPKMDASTATSVTNVKAYRENYPDGKPRITWSSGVANDGRTVLEGRETWFYPNGAKQRETDYHLGKKTGQETYWTAGGKKEWEWSHKADGTSTWITYWENGEKRSESTWKNHELVADAAKFFEHAAMQKAK